MIPIKLELKNFMAYRSAVTLDWSGLHVVCLTGENGAGKSTLLDAITYALWGEARARRDDELIAQGESEMRVALIFGEGAQQYQVIRSRKVGKATGKSKAAPSSSGTLDFLIKNADGWTSLSETKQSDTQQKILDTLNLTYETFVNSAFLKQGRADEFAVKTPAERKALLSEILRLETWQIYDAQARDKLVQIEREESNRAIELTTVESEVERLAEYQSELEAVTQTLKIAEVGLRESEAQLAELQTRRIKRDALNVQFKQTQTALTNIESEITALTQEQSTHKRELDVYQNALAERDAIQQGISELIAARAQNDTLNRTLASLVELNARKSKLEQIIGDARRSIETKRDVSLRALDQLNQVKQEAAQVEQQLSRATSQLETFSQQSTARDRLLQQQLEIRAKVIEVKQQNDNLSREMKLQKDRINGIQKVASICPTCGRELDTQQRDILIETWTSEGREMGDLYRANQTFLGELEQQQKDIEGNLSTADRAVRQLSGAQGEVTLLQERLQKLTRESARESELNSELAQHTATLAQSDYAHEAQADLVELQSQLAQLGYDAKQHAQLRDVVLPHLQVFDERKAQLDRAEFAIQSSQRALEAIQIRIEKTSAQRDETSRTLSQIQQDIEQHNTALMQLPEQEVKRNKSRDEFFGAQRKVGEANQKIAAVKNLESKRARLQKELNDLAQAKSIHKELREAFGKNGVPAMIIEAVLPDLEISANDLLGRMSNGRMSLQFETQRLTKSNDVSETLEIRVRDDLGERPYEMFSGGESFRINFAIRIALSKLLAHRQGAQLQTLFIDEGFGTQDAQGRERLIEAIRAIENDFERIVVITHIEELKDAFPAHIEVTKTANGSMARIV